jgi:predicted small metal-binding protein
MLEQPTVKCPSCESDIRAADESGLVNILQEHLYEEHALDTPRERVRENVSPS